MPTISKENYIKAIYIESTKNGKSASTAKLAQTLSVSNAAISDMAKKLSIEGLVIYKKYKGIELTDAGKKIALKVIRRHRLWELFLIKVFDLTWSEVHDQAEILEHHSSDFLIDKIDAFLEYPEFDPHGHPIPKKNGTLPKLPKYILLSIADKGKKYRLVQVNDSDNNLINYLSQIGLLLNTEFELINKLDFDNSVTIKLNDEMITLSQKITENIYVNHSC